MAFKFPSLIGAWPVYAAAAAVLVGAVAWHSALVSSVRKEGRDDGQKELRLQLERDHSIALTETLKRIASLSTALKEARDVATTESAKTSTSFGKSRAAGDSVRKLAASATLEDRVAAASCAVRGKVASEAFRLAQSCRDSVAEIGLGPDGLVEAATSAHYENARAEAMIPLMNHDLFKMPTSPFTPKTGASK